MPVLFFDVPMASFVSYKDNIEEVNYVSYKYRDRFNASYMSYKPLPVVLSSYVNLLTKNLNEVSYILFRQKTNSTNYINYKNLKINEPSYTTYKYKAFRKSNYITLKKQSLQIPSYVSYKYKVSVT